MQITISVTGQQPIALTGVEKYLVTPTATMDFLNETATIQGNTVFATEWIQIDKNNLNEWDIESNAPTTCNHNTVPVANLQTCTAWNMATPGVYTMDCKNTNNGQTEVDHFVVAAVGNAITKQNVTILVNNQVIQTNSIVYSVTGVAPTMADFTRPTNCAPALQRMRPSFTKYN